MFWLADFDVFPKFSDKNVRQRSVFGGLLTVITFLWLCLLVFSKIQLLLNPSIVSSIVMDNEPIHGQEKLFVFFDISIKSPCTVLHIDQSEDSGAIKLDIIENITRTRLDSQGTPIAESLLNRLKSKKPKPSNLSEGYCGSCYGALPRDKCCNTCQDVVNAIISKKWSFYGYDRWEQCIREGYADFGEEMCRIEGSLKIRRGTGEFHIGHGSNILDSSIKKHIHDVSSIKQTHSLNHTFLRFNMGPSFIGYEPPLQGVSAELPTLAENLWKVEYYLQVVSAKWFPGRSAPLDSYQYTATYSQKQISRDSKKSAPGISFKYAFLPMKVVYSIQRTTLGDFIGEVGGLIGGAFSFATIIDALTYGALSTLRGKKAIGKDV